MKIGIDIMGGDYAPKASVLGAIQAQEELSDEVSLVLIGDEVQIKAILESQNVSPDKFEIVHTDEFIEMGDHPAKAFAAKPKSSIAVGFHLLKKKQIDGFASAGNTGAMLVGAMYTVKSILGVIRPCISAELPQYKGKPAILLDVGINPDCRPDVLYQYGVIGSVYAKQVFGIENPKVALLNIGSEEQKGNLIVKSTYELMKDTKDFNFIGNVEANDLLGENPADVVVCDGFTGNVVLKEAEGIYKILMQRGIKDDFFHRFNPEVHGGTPILGVNSTVIIGHGASSPKAIKTMILKTKDVIEAKVSEKLIELYQ
ncbi:MAG: phosphate acyltransferase PlsX [Salinivirgaceae bacterium]|jgi:glycerol-3-phosphate acyltransferase PlsX|nr:phosphate acyltransferase PlsX [Salinivirgaceae bacterium]